jgi:hypothetical protein
MHRRVMYTVPISRGEMAMRRPILFLLLWTVCLVAGWGCGKEPPLVKKEPMRNNRVPTQRFGTGKTP